MGALADPGGARVQSFSGRMRLLLRRSSIPPHHAQRLIEGPMQKLLAFPAHLARASETLFILTAVMTGLVLCNALEYGLARLGVHDFQKAELLRYGVPGLFVGAVVIAPVLETFLGQHLPILLARVLGARTAIQFAAG